MFSIVIVGNSKSFMKDGFFITPRGYRIDKWLV
jgi:precorrin-3B C17-methyltransferase